MNLFYEWTILQLDAYPQIDGRMDVVFVVHWQQTANNGSGITAQVYGAQEIKLNPDDPFTPYQDLTQAQVVGWVVNALGEETLLKQKKYLEQQIKNQINPPVITPPLPWGDDFQSLMEYQIPSLVSLKPTNTVPIDTVPVDPFPIDPTPVDPFPIDPTPVDPFPIDPTPVDQFPIDPTPVDPFPIDPTPVDPFPIDPTPIDPILILSE